MTVRILCGDVLDKLKGLPDEHFGVVVTSPPYWGLRDYGVDGQIGLEPTLGEHLDRMVEVFREVRRVLKQDGVLWVNYGDCYATAPNGRSAADTKSNGGDDRTFRDKPFSTVGPVYDPDRETGDRRGGLCKQTRNEGSNHTGRITSGGFMKPKDLCMVPNRFAIAMQEDGWWVRSEIIWAKPNPMPESVRDRPASAHEKVFMFTKAPRYHYDAEAVRAEAAKKGTPGHLKPGKNSRVSIRRTPGASADHKGSDYDPVANGRNLRNFEPAPVQVWQIATRPFSEAHFATFPPELVERCLKASLRKGDAVLDPFGGAGTTGLVAEAFGADCTLIEINKEYCGIAERRLAAGLVRLADKPASETIDIGLFSGVEGA